jgi:hypothetical protein
MFETNISVCVDMYTCDVCVKAEATQTLRRNIMAFRMFTHVWFPGLVTVITRMQQSQGNGNELTLDSQLFSLHTTHPTSRSCTETCLLVDVHGTPQSTT